MHYIGINTICCRLMTLAVLLPASLHSTAESTSPNDALHMVYYDGRQPYSYTENGRMTGIWIAIVDEICKRMAIKVTHEGYPWARAQAMVRDGQADAMLTAATEERLTYAIDAGYVVTLPGQTYTWAGNPQTPKLNEIRQWNDLKAYSVVSYLGNGVVKLYLGDANVAWQPTEGSALRLLALRRYDATIDNPVMIERIAKEEGLQGKVVAVGPKLPGFAYELLIGKQSKFAGRTEQFAKTLGAMQRDGTIAAIVKSNGG